MNTIMKVYRFRDLGFLPYPKERKYSLEKSRSFSIDGIHVVMAYLLFFQFKTCLHVYLAAQLLFRAQATVCDFSLLSGRDLSPKYQGKMSNGLSFQLSSITSSFSSDDFNVRRVISISFFLCVFFYRIYQNQYHKHYSGGKILVKQFARLY